MVKPPESFERVLEQRMLARECMKKNHLLGSDPLVLDATLTDDTFDLLLTQEGYETMEAALELLRETNPKATYNDVLKWMLKTLIERLEAELN